MIMARAACWRIVETPSVGDGSGSQETASTDPVLQGLLDQLRDLDSRGPKSLDAGGSNKEIVEYNLARATLLEQIYKKVKNEEKEQWVRQVADCLGAAAQNSGETDTRGYDRLLTLEKLLVAGAPGTQITAYVAFREMAAENAVSLAKRGVDVNKVQDQWLQRLAKFVEAYPKAEDAPEALMQLGMVSEFVNKEVDAKKWYEMLTKQFGTHPLAAKAAGAMKRLDVEGKVLELAGPTMDGGNFNISQLRGKTVIVYYWASWNKERTVGDFASLKLLLQTYASRGVELVCVNLDNTAAEAAAFLQRSPSPSVQIFQPGGLESPQAIQYGVMVLPNLFLVDKEGKVASRTVQVGNLEEELKKRLN
jgi:AhpC/TSA family